MGRAPRPGRKRLAAGARSCLLRTSEPRRPQRLVHRLVGRAAGRVQVGRGLPDDRGRSRERRGRRHVHRQPAEEDLLDHLAVGGSDAFDGAPRRQVGAALDGEIEGVAQDGRV